MAPDPVELALILGRMFESLGIRYRFGGSVARYATHRVLT